MSPDVMLNGASEALANGDFVAALDWLDSYAELRKRVTVTPEQEKRWQDLENQLRPHLNEYWDRRAEAAGIL